MNALKIKLKKMQSADQIDSFINIPAVESEFEAIDVLIEKTRAKILSMPKAMQDYHNASGSSDTRRAAQEITESNNQLTQSYDKVTQAKQRLSFLSTQEAKDLALLNTQRQETQKNLKTEAQLQNSVAGSIEKASIQVKGLEYQLKILNITTEAGKGKQTELITEIDRLNKFIYQNSSALTKQRLDIGNYGGAVDGLKGILAGLASEINQATQAFGANSQQASEVQAKYNIVAGLLERQEAGFKNVTVSIRAAENALRTLNESGITGENFDKLRLSIAGAAQQLNVFREGQKVLDSATPTLTALTVAAKGAGGAYAIGAGAVALFGDENGKLQQKLQPLIGIMTLLQGLDEVEQFLRQKNAILLQLESKATEALTFAKKLLGLSTVENVAANEAEAASAGEVAVANEAVATSAVDATVALEGEAAAAEITTVALEGVTGATVGAEAAIISLDTVIAATVIGAVIIAIAVAVTYLVEKVYDWVEADKIAAKTQTALAESVKQLSDNIKEEIDLLEKVAQANKIKYDEELSQSEKSGQNQEKLFSIKKKIAEFDLRQNEIQNERASAELGEDVNQSNLNTHIANVDDFNGQINSVIRDQEAYKSANKGKENSDYKDKIENLTKRRDAEKSIQDQEFSILENGTKARNSLRELETEEIKYNDDEKRKLILESSRIEVQLNKAKNESILNNDKSNLAERLAALQSNSTQDKILAQSELNDILSNPSSSKDDKILAQNKFDSENKQRGISLRDQEKKLREDYRKQDLAAESSYQKSLIDIEDSALQFLMKDEERTFQEKTDAANKFYSNQLILAKQSYTDKLIALNLSDSQIKSLQSDPIARVTNDPTKNRQIQAAGAQYQTDIVNISSSQQSSISDNIKLEIEKRKKDQDEYYKTLQSLDNSANLKIAQNNASETEVLQKKFTSGIINYKQYKADLAKIDEDAKNKTLNNNLSTLQLQLSGSGGDQTKNITDLTGQLSDANNNASTPGLSDADKKKADQKVIDIQTQLDAAKSAQEKYLQLEKELADARKNLSLSAADVEEKTRQAREEKELSSINKIQSAYVAFYTLAGGLIKANAEKVIDESERQIEANNQQKEIEIQDIQASTLSNQQKQSQIAILNKKTQDENNALRQKEREAKIKEAEFEKANAIFSIILNTAKAVVTFLGKGDIPEAVIAGITGAAQLAVAIAQPIPKFFTGTEYSPEGIAWTDEKGAELYIKPSGEMSVGSDKGANLKYLERGTKIIPHDSVNDYLLSSVMPIIPLQQMPSSNLNIENKLDDLIRVHSNSSKAQVSAIRKSRPIINLENNGAFWDYINKSI